jgi:hypothetical protein
MACVTEQPAFTTASDDGWTVNTLKLHYDALRVADERLRVADERFLNERDRRNTEVQTAKEIALHVKEVADAEALRLQRENSTTKDIQAEKLRDQVGSERGIYATRDDLLAAIEKVMEHVSPVIEYVSKQQGRSGGLNAGWVYLVGAIAAFAALKQFGG